MKLAAEVGAVVIGCSLFMAATPASTTSTFLLGLTLGAALYRWIAPQLTGDSNNGK